MARPTPPFQSTPPTSQPNSNAPLGQGGRFAALQNKLNNQGVNNPKALAASIGRKKHGNKKMQQLAAIGRRMKKNNAS